MELKIGSNSETRIYFIRGERVILDCDLADYYGMSAKRLNEQIGRNLERFPEDFSFILSSDEYKALKHNLRPLTKGTHRKYLPRAFTEQGIAMTTGVLRNRVAVQLNIELFRVFKRLREEKTKSVQQKAPLQEIELSPAGTFTIERWTNPQRPIPRLVEPSKPPMAKNIHTKIDLIKKFVADFFQIKIRDLSGPKRSKEIALARQVAIYLVREELGLSYKEIGVIFSKKDHSTIIHACKKIESISTDDLSVKEVIDNCINRLAC